MSYNGWKNYETWNVTLWIGNDEGMYNFAKECGTYENFVEQMREVGYTETPDNVAYNDSGLDLPRIEEYFNDLQFSKLLSIKDLRGPGFHNPLTVNDLCQTQIIQEPNQYSEQNDYFDHICFTFD